MSRSFPRLYRSFPGTCLWRESIERSSSITIRSSFFFQAEDGIRDYKVTGVQTCALPICARAGIDAQRPLLTYIGRVAHEKNIGFLVQVFRRVLASVPEALLVIAGEGPARASLRRQVAHLGLEGRVHFAGYLERDSALLDC